MSDSANTDSIQAKQQSLLDDLSIFQQWEERYEYVISLGRKLPEMPDARKTEDRLIKGCQSQVWVDADLSESGELSYLADSDSSITKGIIALFVHVLNGEHRDAILKSDLSFIEQTGLREHLSSTRANALNLMATEMKRLALAG